MLVDGAESPVPQLTHHVFEVQSKAGKEALFGFFVGQTMKAMQGKANPQVVNQLLKGKLG